ncbi:A/G-specific adenine glycosylase [Flavobacterium sp.]|jgi:A/G-specific adenine glycosylase|uniref:A/G-specific adenine glycosylase n=1 Tax=Flavobacterium sp. TaxID=239 RepID=UPI0037BFBB00
MEFSNSLIKWYLQNKRDLPWRNTINPYPIWLSEIMLQQTRVAQGLPYFMAFMEAFPTVFDLANAEEEQVLKLWQGLGYYSRARNLHATAKYIATELKGDFPPNYDQLLQLKGVGEYTAAAIASFAYNEPVAVVDGNVFRVLSRYFNMDNDISDGKTKKEFQILAQQLLPNDKAALFNQAIMEFGALQCVPKNPDCGNCIFSSSCAGLQHKKVNTLPVKSKKTKVTNKFFNYLILKDIQGNFVVQKREGKGIWENLYEFTLIETPEMSNEINFMNQLKVTKFYNQLPADINLLNTEVIQHKLSHQNLHIQFYILNFNQKIKEAKSLSEIQKLPFPIVIHNFMQTHCFNSL